MNLHLCMHIIKIGHSPATSLWKLMVKRDGME